MTGTSNAVDFAAMALALSEAVWQNTGLHLPPHPGNIKDKIKVRTPPVASFKLVINVVKVHVFDYFI